MFKKADDIQTEEGRRDNKKNDREEGIQRRLKRQSLVEEMMLKEGMALDSPYAGCHPLVIKRKEYSPSLTILFCRPGGYARPGGRPNACCAFPSASWGDMSGIPRLADMIAGSLN
jgi:hypothetical protein